MARMFREAYEQEGVLNQADVSQLIGVNTGTIGKDIRECQIAHDEVLPYRRTIHDIGSTLTHKRIIIQQFVRNIPTPEIARWTSHSEEECDRYIKAFGRVRMLKDRMDVRGIASTLEMNEYLVKENLEILEEHERSGISA